MSQQTGREAPQIRSANLAEVDIATRPSHRVRSGRNSGNQRQMRTLQLRGKSFMI